MFTFETVHVASFGTLSDEDRKNIPTLKVYNNILDFTNVIGNYNTIKIEPFKKGITIITKVDDDTTRIKSIIKGTILNVIDEERCYILNILLNNNIFINIMCSKYNGVDNIIETKDPMHLYHISYENPNNKEILSHVGKPFDIGFIGSRDYYHISNGSKRLD